MSEDKLKVKDLATALGKQAKDIVAVAKELGIIAAKTANSSLTEQEVSRLRSHFSGDTGEKRDDVIVRRRRKEEGSTDKESAVSNEDLDTEKLEKADAPAAVATEVVAKAKPEAASKEQKPAGARIVKRAGEGESPKNEAVSAEKVQEKSILAAEPVVKSSSTAAFVGEDTIKEVASSDTATDLTKKTGARVVRPAAFSAEPERNAAGQTVSSAPAMPLREGEQEGKEDTAASISQVRVISRPKPAEQKPRAGGEQRPGSGHNASARSARPTTDQRPAKDSGAAPAKTTGPTGRMFEAYMPTDGGEQARKKRQKGRRTTTTFRNDEDSSWNKASGRRNKGRGKNRDAGPKGGTQPVKAVKRKIKIEELIRLADFAHQMGLKSGEVIKILFNLGVMATINQYLDIETATLVAIEFGYEVEKIGFSEDDVFEAQHEAAAEDPSKLIPRPPVVTIMGHVDHGKTSLLDAIRKASVVTGEAGGITQHIGAYHVATKKGEIVFLDTPGHEAFTAMRARGAEVTDLVVLVVAADDGVMEQTREAISHAKAAGVPIMVAVNKIDKPAADPDRVKRELSDAGLVAEDWGGNTVFSYVSAKTREGLDDLLELLALQAEILELTANADRPAIGRIVEAKLDKGRGALGTVLIQQGTLRTGDVFVCGVHSGRVRAMFDDQGKTVKEATPSMPVEVQGFEGVPEAGEEFISLPDEKTARRIAEARLLKQRERDLAKESKVTLETFLASKPDSFEAAILNLVIKSDVQGSLEAVIDAVNKLSTEAVRINVMHGGTGAISESDVLLATASNAIILAFNVRPTPKAKELAEIEKVDIRFYDIIYKLVEEIKSAMEGLLAPVTREVVLGTAEVRETFSVPKIGLVAGCHVSDGKIVRNCLVRLLRDGIVVHTGKLGSLRRFKDDVREVAKGYECGLGIENYNDVKVGDVIEAFEIVEEAAKL